MGVLVPHDFPLTSLKNDAERSVVQALVDQLSDGWFIVPSLQIAGDSRDYELDVVAVHPAYGIIDIEVKGHHVSVENGLWYAGGKLMEPQPFTQARTNAYSLRDKLRNRFPEEFQWVNVNYAVALPNCKSFDGDLPLECGRDQLWLSGDLDDIADRVQAVFINRPGIIFPEQATDLVIRTIRPDVSFTYDPEAIAERNKARLEEICRAQVQAMETLDANRRVFVSGKAGTGKTRLATNWALRARAREERVLFVCFNEPLADQIRMRLPATDDEFVMGPFLPIARTLPGMPPIFEPPNMSREQQTHFWDVEVNNHLQLNWTAIDSQFDTIVIDEAQDFSPVWIQLLESLLDPNGPRRILMVGDPDQDIFGRGFTPPNPDSGWTVGELLNNCRNTLQIARVLRRTMGGAAAPFAGPESRGIDFHAVADEELSRTELLGQVLESCNSMDTVVIVRTVNLRDELKKNLGLGSWETREHAIPCETVRRLKGTEFGTVVIVDPDGAMSEQDLYISISRAVNRLVVVGPQELGEYLGLAAKPAE